MDAGGFITVEAARAAGLSFTGHVIWVASVVCRAGKMREEGIEDKLYEEMQDK